MPAAPMAAPSNGACVLPRPAPDSLRPAAVSFSRTQHGKTKAMPNGRLQITTYSDSMASVSDNRGSLLAVTNGPLAISYAAALAELPDLLRELHAAIPETRSDERPSRLAVAAAHLLMCAGVFWFSSPEVGLPGLEDVPRPEDAP
jgi:hypothetical protein